MSEIFSQAYIEPDQRVEEGVLHSLEDCPDGYRLWFAPLEAFPVGPLTGFARRLAPLELLTGLAWPLQFIRFDAVVATPRKLSSLEKVLLHIYQAMHDHPPDSATIAQKLGIKDSFFVNETITELTMSGALQVDSEGKIGITDMGCECHSRGRLPSEPCQKRLLILFDPIAHGFPDEILVFDEDQDNSEDFTLEHIDTDFKSADANRIDLETIQKTEKTQGLLSGEDAVIFDAKPVETEESGEEISSRQIYLRVFSNDKEQVKLCVIDPKSSSATKWFQRILEARLKEGRIDWAYLQDLHQATISQNISQEINGNTDNGL